MSNDNNKQLEQAFTDLEDNHDDDNQHYVDMTKALIFGLSVIAFGLIIVIVDIWSSSFNQ